MIDSWLCQRQGRTDCMAKKQLSDPIRRLNSSLKTAKQSRTLVKLVSLPNPFFRDTPVERLAQLRKESLSSGTWMRIRSATLPSKTSAQTHAYPFLFDYCSVATKLSKTFDSTLLRLISPSYFCHIQLFLRALDYGSLGRLTTSTHVILAHQRGQAFADGTTLVCA